MFKRENLSYLIIFLISLVLFHFTYGFEKLDPTNINWLMSAYHDWGTHYLGWSFYRNDPWTFPLGEIQSYNYPVGTNIGFTDSIPLLALILKPFSSLLPEDFQYFGFWLYLSSLLVGLYTFKLLELYKINRLVSFLIVVVLMLNPVLLFRSIHPALCAQWLILASFYYYLKEANSANVGLINNRQIILLFLSATITPYLTAMIISFNIILPFKHYRAKLISGKVAVLYFVKAVFLIIGFWIVLGMIEFNAGTNLASVDDFKNYSFNLNGFFDSYGYYSKFIPDLGKINPMQYEGFSYLGLGIILLLPIALFMIVSKSVRYKLWLNARVKHWGYLILICVLMLFFALTNQITLSNQVLGEIPIGGIVQKLFFTFRAAGRFVWPLYYLIIIVTFITVAKINIKDKYKVLLLILVVAIQIFDTSTVITEKRIFPSGTYKTPLSDKKWVNVIGNFDNVIIYPPFNYNYSMTYNNDYQDLCYLALKAKKPISNAYVARANIRKVESFKLELQKKLNSGIIDEKRLFITTADYIGSFSSLIKEKKVDIQKLDNFIFIYSKKLKVSNSNFQNDNETLKYIDSVKTHYENQKSFGFFPALFKLKDENSISSYFDTFEFKDNILQLRGWAYLKETNNNKGDAIYIALSSKRDSVIMLLDIDKRSDITQAFKKEFLDDAGFNTSLDVSALAKEQYQVGIFIRDKKGNYHYLETEKSIIVK